MAYSNTTKLLYSYCIKIIKKKANVVACEDHRIISLVAHASKIVLRVLTNRIEAKAKDFISNNQFGFRKGVGTRDAIGVMKMLGERSLEFGNEVFICFSWILKKRLIE